LKDGLATLQKENIELKAKQEDVEYDLQRATKQFEKLIKKLNETHEQTKAGGSTSGTVVVTSPGHGHVKLIKDATVGIFNFIFCLFVLINDV
jgi:hypothetical protein